MSHSEGTHATPGPSSGEAHPEDLREASFGELAKSLSQDISTLVRQEIALARAEMTQKGKRAVPGIGMFGAAGLIGLGAFGALTACLIALLATALNHTWLAALIVALVYGAIARVLALRGKDKLTEATPPIPQTTETVKEGVAWAKTLK